MESILSWLRALPEEAKAILMGLIEGITEFLPISSTGHLIVMGWLLEFDDEASKAFNIAIQAGAVLAIVWLYRIRFLRAVGAIAGDAPSHRLVPHLFVAFLPAAILGLLFGSAIKTFLFSPVPVAMALILGGLIILWVERRPESARRIESVEEMTWRDALKIGLAQAFALIPGTSRSGATIIGGMLFGFSRKTATEFSFFLAVPTIFAASAYSLYKDWQLLSVDDLLPFCLGFFSAFVSALFVVQWLIRFVSNHKFTGFAYYRIVFGLVVLMSWQLGWIEWTLD